MPERTRITERSLYAPIINLFRSAANRYGVELVSVQEVDTGRRYPDILVYINGYKILIQVKINRVSKLMEDIVKSYPIARQFNAELVGILFPSEVRQVNPRQLEQVAPHLRVSRALLLTQWLSSDVENIDLIRIIEELVKAVSYTHLTLPTTERV